MPPKGAEPKACLGEDPRAYAKRAAKAKALSLLSLLAQEGKNTFLCPCSSDSFFSFQKEQALLGVENIPDVTVEKVSLPQSLPNLIILAADTIVVKDKSILGKPKDANHALEMLKALVGGEHEVITGCSLVTPQGLFSFACCTRVHMWKCEVSTLEAYVRTKEPMDKAGAYAIQGIGAFLVQSIQGSWTNVVGLPVAEVLQLLFALGCLCSSNKVGGGEKNA